jgi:hypothetical protein
MNKLDIMMQILRNEKIAVYFLKDCKRFKVEES